MKIYSAFAVLSFVGQIGAQVTLVEERRWPELYFEGKYNAYADARLEKIGQILEEMEINKEAWVRNETLPEHRQVVELTHKQYNEL